MEYFYLFPFRGLNIYLTLIFQLQRTLENNYMSQSPKMFPPISSYKYFKISVF